MHKYWGKKPSNNLNKLIEKYSKPGDTVLDPFAGYGVFCCEAFILNRNVVANDLNPAANFITRQLLELNVDIKKVIREWKLIKQSFLPFIDSWYKINVRGKEVIPTSILRDKNDLPIMFKYKTEESNKSIEVKINKKDALEFLEFEKDQEINDWYPSDLLIENSRISAKKNMAVADLFTRRTLACHARLLRLIDNYSDGNERELLRLAFTANLANCSKLVPPIKSRGPMAPGAWMTGFYIGETYLENNVIHYFENRFNKIIKGKKDFLSFFENKNENLNINLSENTYFINRDDAKNLRIPDESIDYVFTDPPYGDAVPYFEQSIIWNSWLKLEPDYKNEIVITDSKARNKGIKEFEQEIEMAFSEIRRVLKRDGFFSLTYHSLSGLEWKAITNGCIKNGFEMVDFEWLVQKTFTPRQINRLKSIKGDVLVTLRKSEIIKPIFRGDEEITKFFIDKIKSWLTHSDLDTNQIFLKIMKIIFEEKIIIGEINLLDVLIKNFSFTENKKWTLYDEFKLCRTRA